MPKKKKKVAKKEGMDTPYDPSRKGKGGPYGPPIPGGGTNPFRTALKTKKKKKKNA